MGFVDSMEEVARKLRWYDIGFVKITVFFFTLFLIVTWDGFRNVALQVPWWVYLALIVIFAIPVYIRIFFDN